jgi:hypothetical protein
METWEKPPTTDCAWQGFILPIILGYLERHIYTSAVFTFVKAFLVSLQLMICQLLTPVLLRVDSGCLQGRHHLALGHQLRSPFCTLCLIVLCVHDSKGDHVSLPSVSLRSLQLITSKWKSNRDAKKHGCKMETSNRVPAEGCISIIFS